MVYAAPLVLDFVDVVQGRCPWLNYTLTFGAQNYPGPPDYPP